MLEPGLGDKAEKSALREAMAEFEKQKSTIQDHILERTSVVPEENAIEIMKKFKLSEELAKLIFVLELEYKVPQELAANYYSHEMNRLKKLNYELPDIYSFLIQFAVEEGFWIKYSTNDLSKKLSHKISKLLTLDRSLFGDLEGKKEDSALYMIERSFLIREIIKPIIYSWVKDHQRSNFYDAAISIICGMRFKDSNKGEFIVEELCNRFCSNVESIKGIIAELDTKGWANNAIKEFEAIQEHLVECKDDKTKMGWRIVAELILENRLVLEYESLDLNESIFSAKTKTTFESSESFQSPGFIAKEGEMIGDKLTKILISIDDIPLEKLPRLLHNMVVEYFNEATLTKRQKPSIFAKEFLKKIMDLLNIESTAAKKKYKIFESQLMHSLSPMGSKKYSNVSVDERVMSLLEEFILEIIALKDKMQPEKTFDEKQTLGTKSESVQEDFVLQKEDSELGVKLKESSEKEIWLLIRDLYLKELFNDPEELKAGAIVLKKLSLELGLLLTENEAVTLIRTELEKLGTVIEEGNNEEIDKNVCKVVFAQVKEQRRYQIKKG